MQKVCMPAYFSGIDRGRTGVYYLYDKTFFRIEEEVMPIFIHDSAEVSERALIGENTKIWNLVQIRENAVIGENCIISKNVYIDRDVKIGNRVKIQNNVNVYCGVTIGNDVF